ncbi:MAG: 5-amino-6-(D-ribitylamino)uracil--L-tyrosine 4-hydroxyphenyl transferase CofH [Gammaproteobacteria bacterium]
MNTLEKVINDAYADCLPTREDLQILVDAADSQAGMTALMSAASELRDREFLNVITYSKKVFIPLTHLCRDVCHYCTFAQAPKRVAAPYMSPGAVIESAQQAAALGCKEALFTLGEKPELRYATARDALAEMGFESTLEYAHEVARRVFEETGLLPHLNPGTMTPEELSVGRTVSPSMGIMLESAAERLTEKGLPHYGSPDKIPAVRLETLADAGKLNIPFTTGILIGIGETRFERLESLLAIREIHERFGHVQEIIIQNFRAKANTKMVNAPEPDLHEMLWTLAAARVMFGSSMSIQAPPNLSPGVLPQLIDAGINDWGGVSPVTPDFVNPEAPWPHLENLAAETERAGKYLHERLTVYPKYAIDGERWLDENFRTPVLQAIDAEGFPRTDEWSPGEDVAPPREILNRSGNNATAQDKQKGAMSSDMELIFQSVREGKGGELTETQIARLFRARGEDFSAVCRFADELRVKTNGDTVSYVVNRNINYTNICYFKCQFCAFSKGKLSENLRGKPYDLDAEEIQRRVIEAYERGATEVCMQGGIHPHYTGQTYLNIVKKVKEAVPEIHLHAFSPLEVWQGAQTAGYDLASFLRELKLAGLGTLPGTAAEVLDDEVRRILCPDKINTMQWLAVMEAAHGVGFNTTATIMYGHVDRVENWARHLIRIRDLQKKTGGFTEFVPLPFVHMEAPLYLKGRARKGPTFREAMLMHAVARIVLHGYIDNIQASWVKMGHEGVVACLNAGVNDLGGTLMNESITRAAGTKHGQETSPQLMLDMINSAGRIPKQRTTVYTEVDPERQRAGLAAGRLSEIVNTPAKKFERPKKTKLIKNETGTQRPDRALP